MWKEKHKTLEVQNNGTPWAINSRAIILDDHLICKVKDIAIKTCQAGGVINRRQIDNIAKGVVRVNNPDILKKFGRTVELINWWARGIFTQLN